MSQIGEAFVGTGAEAAHVNTVLGHRGGPVETAWATALATPREGHVPFVVAAQPGIAVKPMTLFVNKAAIQNDEHAAITWGAAQAGVAAGVLDALAEHLISHTEVDELVLIVAVWVDPAARDADAVFENNRAATRQSIDNGVRRAPSVAEALAVRERTINGYFVSPPLR